MKKILPAFFFAPLLFVYALSYGDNYKLICDDLDQTGGKGNSTNYKLVVLAGGQSSPIGSGISTHYKVMAGYVGATFVQRGDATADGGINAADVVYLINYLYIGGPQPIPFEAGDINCDGKITTAECRVMLPVLTFEPNKLGNYNLITFALGAITLLRPSS